MGLFTVQSITISKIPNASPLLLPNPKSSFPLRKVPTIRTAPQLSRPICLRNVLSKATSSDESSTGATHGFDEKRDGIIVLDDVEAVDKKGFNEVDPKHKLPVEEQEGTSLNVLDNLNIKFDADDAGSVVFYAGGAVLALWLTSAIIGAIDSIPLFPKVLEVVGLGYTIWFTSRYLIFKKNRVELVAKVEVLKEQVLGSEN